MTPTEHSHTDALEQLRAHLAGRYVLAGEVGSGGMATVYLAEDLRHRRQVAIKVLRPEVATALGPERFLQEIAIAAQLNHPHILAVHDSGDAGGVLYYVMPYVAGESLRDRLSREVQLPIADAVRITLEIADALAYAHEHGIVHRDIKPENIMLAGEHAVVTDFGIARAVHAAGNERLTATGIAVGTPVYMSPEQAAGAPNIDGRSDVYSLACILYEMLAGDPPFAGTNSQAVLSRKLVDDPPHVRSARKTVGAALDDVITRALATAPADRIASARRFAEELRSAAGADTGAAAVPGARRLTARWRRLRWPARSAVFASIGLGLALGMYQFYRPAPLLGFAARDWMLLGDFEHHLPDSALTRAMALALRTGLEQSTHVNIVPRARVERLLQLMEKPASTVINEPVARELGERAGVKGLLLPDLRAVGNQYVLTLRLLDPVTGAAAATLTRQAAGADDLLGALDDALRELRARLGEALRTLRATPRLPEITTASLPALKAFTAGRNAWNAGRYRESAKHFEEALKSDSTFAFAHASLANAYASWLFHQPDKARQHFAAALARADRLSARERYWIQAQYHSHFGQRQEAIRFFRMQLDQFPDDMGARHNIANLYRESGDCASAVAEYAQVLRIDSTDAGAMINIATCQVTQLALDSAITNYQRAFALQPRWLAAGNLNHEYGMTLILAGRLADAKAAFEQRRANADPDERGHALRSLSQVEMYQGRARNAIELLSQAASLHEAAGYLGSVARDRHWLATAQIVAGRLDAATATLRRALAQVPDETGWLWVRALIGGSYVAAGQLNEARAVLQHLERAASRGPERDTDQKARLLLEAKVLTAGGAPQRAIELLAPVRDNELLPNMHTQLALAEAYLATEQWTEAARTLKTLIGLRHITYEGLVPWILAHRLYAQVAERLGEKDEAIAHYERFIDLWKDADPELQPMIQDARRRVAALRGALR